MKEEITENKDSRPKDKVSFRKTFSALRHKNYRLWFWGQMTSLFGSWMQTTAQGYLVYELTHSPVYLGYVGFASGVPAWLFMIFGGVVADRVPRRTILVITQTIMMILAFVLAGLTFMGLVEAWHIVVLAFLLGVANAFDSPARQSFVLEMVEREDLVNAIALNATMFNTATAIGPAVAGITYAAFGPAWCFIINGASFIVVIIALLMMKLKPQPKAETRKSAITDLKEGIKYLKKQKMILTLIALITVVGLFGIAFATLIPAWAVKILHGDATTNGLLQSARGLGALLSALFIASVSHYKIKGKLVNIGTFAFPLTLIIFSFIRWEPLSLLMLVAIGASSILILNVVNALVQTLVSDEFRGRVMGIYSISFFGFMPLGALLIGFLAEHLGEPEAIIINSAALLLFALIIFIKVPQLRAQK
ncbi:MAG: MFS transporter [Ignavibacteria bacterium]|nr:MFS transporter [Ignavibacteria bacterium]MCU7503695.1 MFS transporter [Ignavibacteria bacterium]MCU7517658.1 MFS transporter [Ignavibacteria bacterium]